MNLDGFNYMKIKIYILIGFVLVFWSLFGIPFIDHERESQLQFQIDHLNSADGRIRLIAAANLVSFGDEALPLLLKTIEEDNLRIKIEVIQILGFIGNPKAIDPLIKLFDHKHWRVRFFAIDAFRELKAKKVIPLLKSKIVHDENKNVKLAALLTLGKMEEFDDVEFLKSLLRSKDQYEPYYPAEVSKMIERIESKKPG